jgi:hypothetical protein
MIIDACLYTQVKVLEIVTLCIEVAERRPGANQDAILDIPIPRLGRMRLPTGPVLAVE